MAIGTISNGDSGSSCRTKINAGFTQLDALAPLAGVSGSVVRPSSSGGADLGSYNQGYGDIRVRRVRAESGAGTSACGLDQSYGAVFGSAAKAGWGNGAGDLSAETPDAEIGRFGIGILYFPAMKKPIQIVTATYTVDATPGDYTVVGNHATVAFTVTVLAASTNTGRMLVFKNKGAAAVTVDATALGQFFTTSLVNTIVLVTGDSITVQSDGTSWMVI